MRSVPGQWERGRYLARRDEKRPWRMGARKVPGLRGRIACLASGGEECVRGVETGHRAPGMAAGLHEARWPCTAKQSDPVRPATEAAASCRACLQGRRRDAGERPLQLGEASTLARQRLYELARHGGEATEHGRYLRTRVSSVGPKLAKEPYTATAADYVPTTREAGRGTPGRPHLTVLRSAAQGRTPMLMVRRSTHDHLRAHAAPRWPRTIPRPMNPTWRPEHVRHARQPDWQPEHSA